MYNNNEPPQQCGLIFLGRRMRLWIAEKPSLGRSIADRLAVLNKVEPKATRSDITCGNDVVSWVYGHMLENAPPDTYLPSNVPLGKSGTKIWRLEDLPIFPRDDGWVMLPIAKSQDQLNHIKTLIGRAASIVNAGDAGREGQLLIDEILDYANWRGKTERIWLSATNDSAVDAALGALLDNASKRGLKQSGECRSRADWIFGMNMSRVYSIKNSAGISIGRVQTPTLALVVKRDIEIENFKSKDYFIPRIRVRTNSDEFWATWVPIDDMPGVDAEGRLTNKSMGDDLTLKAKGSPAAVSEFTCTDKKQAAPLPFSLSALQKIASARYGMSAQQTLDTAQSLYEERKMTTYPRTDSEYLPESQFSLAADLLKSLSRIGGRYADVIGKSDSSIHTGVWNDAKITEHHAIIPTGDVSKYGQLNENEKKLFDLILQRYLMQFFPPHLYKSTKVVLSCAGHKWSDIGRVPASPGWKIVLGESAEDDDEDDDKPDTAKIPLLEKGESLPVVDASVISKKTTPPPRFTDGTLIDAMSNIHKFVEDADARATLKESAGIGTVATRAAIMEKLISISYIDRKGKQLISTTKARGLITNLPPELTDPVTTAKWEDALSDIAYNGASATAFMRSIESFIREQLALSTGGIVAGRTPLPSAPCPVCTDGSKVVKMESKNSKGFFFWVCQNREAHNLISDDNGKPGKLLSDRSAAPTTPQTGPKCTACKISTGEYKTGTGKPYFRCSKCRNSWWPDEGKLGKKWDKR